MPTSAGLRWSLILIFATPTHLVQFEGELWESLPNNDKTVIQLDAYLEETDVEHKRHCHLKYSGITEKCDSCERC